MKRILFITLAVLLSTLSASANTFKVDGIVYYTINDGKSVAVTSGGDYTGDIAIPEKVTYDGATYSVTEIGGRAFKGCTGLTSVTIPNSVTEIYSSTFYGCTGLTSVTIPSSVVQIGNAAFESCTALTSISIPNSVTSIGSRTFRSCTNLTNVTIPNSVTYIGDEAFNGTPWYNSIPDGVVYIAKIAYKFKGEKDSCTVINIKEGTVSIGPKAFENCVYLTSITIPNSVTSIGNGAFEKCHELNAVTIPNSVFSIGDRASML